MTNSDSQITRVNVSRSPLSQLEEATQRINQLENLLIAERSYAVDLKGNRAYIYRAETGQWVRHREDGALVETAPPDNLGEYSKGWADCYQSIMAGLDGFKTVATDATERELSLIIQNVEFIKRTLRAMRKK